MSTRLLAGACAFAFLCAAPALAHDQTSHHHGGPNGAPVGVMGTHLHPPGQWMVGYHYRHTFMNGLRNGTNSVSADEVLNTYGEVPLKMTMDMHMFEIMVGVTDDLTLMVMPQYMQMDMLHYSDHGMGHMHRHSVEDFGDTEVTGLYSIHRGEHSRSHLNLGVSLPTGSVNESFTNHHDNTYHLPYNMQLGSGTVDPILGATYVAEAEGWSWGAQTLNYLRLGKNNADYRQGNRHVLNAWVSRGLTDYATAAFRLEGEVWRNVSGRDRNLPLTTLAGANPNEQAGERVMANVSLTLLGDEAGLSGQKLSAEFGLPLYERFSGPQPETDFRLGLGWQWSF